MEIISVWSRKGGTGKTTISYMLAGAAVDRGLKVLLIDDDNQASGVWLSEFNNVPFKVVKGWPEHQPDVDLVIVDMPPRTDDKPLGTVIIPYQATPLDFGATARYIPELRKTNKVIEVINRRRNIAIQNEFIKGISLDKRIIINERSIYQTVTANGRSIFDPDLKNKYGIREAKFEINNLLNEALA